MQLITIAELVVVGWCFHQFIIRPGRQGIFFGKLLLSLVVCLPCIAQLHTFMILPHERHSEGQGQVAVAWTIGAVFVTLPWVISFDYKTSWGQILRQLALYYGSVIAVGGFIMNWQLGGVDGSHVKFLILHTPRVVLQYLSRLPQDGPGYLVQAGEAVLGKR